MRRGSRREVGSANGSKQNTCVQQVTTGPHALSHSTRAGNESAECNCETESASCCEHEKVFAVKRPCPAPTDLQGVRFAHKVVTPVCPAERVCLSTLEFQGGPPDNSVQHPPLFPLVLINK